MPPTPPGRHESGRVSRIVAGAVIAGMLLSTCSDEGTDRQDLIAQADRICSQANSEIEALTKPADPAKAQPYLEKATDIERDAIEQLEKLEPSDEDKEQFQNMIDALRVALFYQPQLQLAVRQKDLAAAEEVRTKISNAVEAAAVIAKDFGLQECARPAAEAR
jgi:hypothetical protein